MDEETTGGQPLAHAVKFVGPNTIEGPAFLFGSRDLHRESFQADTDFCLEWFGKSGRPLLYEHGLDDSLKTGLIGHQSDYEQRAEGIWAQSQLDTNAKYRQGVDALIERGALAYSGGAMQHLATKSASGAIKRFPWVELSLTPTPANPANAGVYYLKSVDAVAHLEEAGVEIPSPLKAALTALDEWATSRDDDALPDGASFADSLDRLTVDAAARVAARKAWHSKSGRVLSAETRERLVGHPASLHELADELGELLGMAEGKATKGVDLTEQLLQFEALQARLLGVPVLSGEPT